MLPTIKSLEARCLKEHRVTLVDIDDTAVFWLIRNIVNETGCDAFKLRRRIELYREKSGRRLRWFSDAEYLEFKHTKTK